MGALLKPILRWVFVMAGAVLGSYGGRIAAAAYRGEPVEPLLRLDRAALMRPDAVPGFLAVELVGKVLNLGPWSAGIVAAAAAAAAFVEGPFVPRRPRPDEAVTPEGGLNPAV